MLEHSESRFSNPTGPLHTAYLPAERASQVQLQDQIDQLNALDSFWELVDVIPNILMVLNRQRQVVFANQTLFDALGLVPEQVLGQRPGEMLGCVHADNLTGGCGTSEFCRTCGAGRAIESSLTGRRSIQECRITQEDGSALDLRVWANPIQVDDHLYSVFAVHDIRHEKRRQALESIFFHDVLNLAGVLLGYSELLDARANPDEIEHIRRTLVRTSVRLVNEIKAQRDLVAAESGELVAEPQSLSARQLVRDVVDYYSGHEVGSKRTLVIAQDAQDVLFDSDRTLLERVLGNMVKNALEAVEPGETVTVSSAVGNGVVSFSVHNPTVIAPSVQLQIFNRSFSTRGPGRGLGTYSMKLLTERYLHGRLSFTSAPGSGTRFVAVYPLEFPKPSPYAHV